MTVVRLSGSELFVHSPTELSPALQKQVEGLGTPRWIIAPSRIHYWWIPQWHSAFPGADIYIAPRVRDQAGMRIDFPCRVLDRDSGLPWSSEIDTLLVAGRYLTEAEFFHRPSRTLILTDLIEMQFAHLKRILRLDRLRLRGPRGARDEFLLAATGSEQVRA